MEPSRVAFVAGGALWVMLPGVGGAKDDAPRNWKPMPPGAVAAAPRIPLRAGLTVVTAVSMKLEGDFESVKRITAVGGDSVSMTYRADVPEPNVSGLLGGLLSSTSDSSSQSPKPLRQLSCTRLIPSVDLKTAREYREYFCEQPQETFPGSTAIGTSEQVLSELKNSGRAAFRYAIGGLGAALGQLQALSNAIANAGRNPPGGKQQNPLTGQSQPATVSCSLARVETSDLAVPVLVNDQRVDLPAIHAACSSDSDQKASFYFLDDPANPLTLAFQLTGTMLGSGGNLQVIKIEIPAQKSNPPQSNDNQIQQQLAKSGRAEVYGIYFDFSSDKIRPESEPVLKEIADALEANPSWKLSVEGHTDNVGGDAYNLDLSNRRAAAVKQALVTTYHIAPERLTPVGFGATRPKESNDTLEGRARNRRVELVRQ